ncbi:MAG: Cna B-type domain-containing protein [Eubacteriales bacterium]|nr:Cna B-type domain-containing protein [Clostridiales bacterium]MDY5835673.1 Cna B-type domain-containing protein [Eubacteriales bacterium]
MKQIGKRKNPRPILGRVRHKQGREGRSLWTVSCLCLLVLVVSFLALPVRTVLAGSPAPSQPLSLQVNLRKAPEGTLGKLYRVADFVPETGAFTPVASFASLTTFKDLLDHPGHFGDPADAQARYAKRVQDQAETLLEWITKNRVSEDQKASSTLASGGESRLHFPVQGKTLVPGLYLVVVEPYEADKTQYLPKVMLVALPGLDPQDGHTLLYARTIEVKLEEKTKPGDLELTVIKLWEAEDGQVLNSMEAMSDQARQGIQAKYPDQVDLVLYQDGRAYAEATLSAANHWQFTFKNLPAGFRYVVSEAKVPAGYDLTLTTEEGKLVLHNRKKPQEPPVPPTETTPIPPPQESKPISPTPEESLPLTAVLWWPVYLFIAGGLLSFCIGLLRRRHQH